jgi:hypothetical protein
MKKYLLISVVCLLLCAGSFFAGARYGEFNGHIEAAAKNTGPLLNLLLIGAGKEKELIDMNRSQLYMNLGLFESLRSSCLVSDENKRLSEQRILFAKDYWQAAGGKILQTEEEKKEDRQRIEKIQSEDGITPGLSINGVSVSPFYFEEQDQQARDLFSRYADQNSVLHDFIITLVGEAKNRPNKPLQGTEGKVPSAPAVPEALRP